MFKNRWILFFNLFKAFLSHRYGSRCLPTRIKANEYEILRKELSENLNVYEKKFYFEDPDIIQIDNMLEFCYVLDDNETPARYRLINRKKLLNDMNKNSVI